MEKCNVRLEILVAIQRIKFRNIVTGDESWFYLDYHHDRQWSVSRDELTQKVKPGISTKSMLTVIWV
jgi:hypothetical protein